MADKMYFVLEVVADNFISMSSAKEYSLDHNKYKQPRIIVSEDLSEIVANQPFMSRLEELKKKNRRY